MDIYADETLSWVRVSVLDVRRSVQGDRKRDQGDHREEFIELMLFSFDNDYILYFVFTL